MHDFQLFIKVYLMKENEKYAYDRKVSNEENSSWTYSLQAIDFIADRLTENPERCLDNLKTALAKKEQ